jgi:AraC-like DNA-binding protein
MTEQKKQFALGLIAYAVQRDVNAGELCKKANIDLPSLKKNPDVVLTRKQFEDLWHHASQLTKDPLFGLHFGETLQLSALGIVGEIIKSSRTVGEAIQMAASLTPLVTDLFSMEIKKVKSFFTIKLFPSKGTDLNFSLRQLADTLMVFAVHELDGLLLEKIKPSSVTYPYVLSNSVEYERVFRCKPSRHKTDFSLQFDNKYLDEPILSASYELQHLLLEKVNSMKIGKAGTGTLGEKIHQHLMTNAYLGILSLEDVARNFNSTPRSLQRRLQEEGMTFQELSESVRKSLAIHYIQSGKHQIKEISDMLGYNELSAFSRAFKRWTGKSPVRYLA